MKFRNTLISLFVVIWIFVFHYESLRYFYFQPFFKKPLPKLKLLFPPAGWIMFYEVGDNDGFLEIYGIRQGQPQRIDPHDIIQVRTIGYDNIHRNILSEVAGTHLRPAFCRYLERKFTYFDSFAVTAVYYPSLSKQRYERVQNVIYECPRKTK